MGTTNFFRMHYVSEERGTCTDSYLLHMLIKSSTQHQTQKSKCWEKKIKVVLLGQKKRLLPQNRKLPLERTFMVFIFSFILSHWSLQLSWQEIILLLDVHFLLIISAVPLDTSTLSQQAQTQGIQIAAQKSECPIHISVEIRLLCRKQSPKLLQVTLYKQFQPTWDEEKMKASRESSVLPV